jgi:pyruvate/2-oxoglutarate dehydrogenase complex dihydrolipoamide acyltransferase (E2) component
MWSPVDGICAKVFAEEGCVVDADQVLLTIRPHDSSDGSIDEKTNAGFASLTIS